MPLSAVALRKAATVSTARSCRRRIEKRGVLALEQADAAKIVRQGDGDVRADLPRISRAAISQLGSSGEKIDETATERSPRSAMRRAAARMPAVSKGTIGRPS